MPLTNYVLEEMLENLVTYFGSVALIRTGVTPSVENNYSSVSAYAMHNGLVPLTWGLPYESSGGIFIDSTNAWNSNPMTWSVQQSVTLNKLVIVAPGNTIQGIIDVVSPPSYSSGSGAYHVRRIIIGIEEDLS